MCPTSTKMRRKIGVYIFILAFGWTAARLLTKTNDNLLIIVSHKGIYDKTSVKIFYSSNRYWTYRVLVRYELSIGRYGLTNTWFLTGSSGGCSPSHMSNIIAFHNIDLQMVKSLQWCHNERVGVSNHQPHNCLLNRLFRRRSKKTSKLRVTGLCAGNSPGTGEFPAQMVSNAENVSIWWRHHEIVDIMAWVNMHIQ